MATRVTIAWHDDIRAVVVCGGAEYLLLWQENAAQWGVFSDGEAVGSLSVDPEAERQFVEQLQSAAQQRGTLAEVLLAEVRGRMAELREETQPMAATWARKIAQRRSTNP